MPTRVAHADRLLKSARIIIPVGFGLVLMAILAVVFSLIRSRDADLLVLHTMEVQKAAQDVLIAVRDADGAKRTYLLTGTPEEQENFTTAMAAVPESSPRSANKRWTTPPSRPASTASPSSSTQSWTN